ncbi:DUF5107 domain-containing protein [Streptomyces sp. NPDC091279]|uniref:DUF5107 domain-containing protein n=1 Tax=Streptomyces sp. NPDC091279 TaxID=3365983 RepID=UPI0038143448
MWIVTTIRREVFTLPAAELGPDNPLPPLRPPTELHHLEQRADLARELGRTYGYAPLRSLLPVRVRDGYDRVRAPRDLPALVIENDRLRATVLPGLGGRLASLLHKPTGRELLYRNPVFQPAAFALNGAWFSGGVEWNIGATGHTTLACAPLHAARVPAPDGGEMLRLWEWERLRDLPFQVDLWLPDHSDFLHVAVRIRNPHETVRAAYWWSNTAVPEGRRVLAPATEAWHLGPERRLRRVPVPAEPADSPYAADYFYDVPGTRRRWIAALDAEGHGLVQTSTDTLRGRKLFVWGTGSGGRRWQEWLTAPGTGGYREIQAGLTRTQLEHVPLAPESEVTWLEAYGPLDADLAGEPDAVTAAAEARLEAVLPRADVEAAHTAWTAYADAEPGEILATGSGWGALELRCTGRKTPGTPYPDSTLGPAQEPWLRLLRTGHLPAPHPAGPPGESLVAPHWRELLETAPSTPATEYHLGVAQWHAGDRAQAVRSWERALARTPSRWPALRALAVADREGGHPERAADRYTEAFDDLCRERSDDGEDGEAWTAATAALGREAIEALLTAGRTAPARAVWDRLDPGTRARGRFRMIEVGLLLAEGRREAARAVFDEGFEVADLREGAEILGRLWSHADDGPLPARYDFRMRPPEEE